MKISILIATMPSRLQKLDDLMSVLNPQIDLNGLHGEVEVLIDPRIDINIGQKRNILLQKAKGDYIVFIDDDDHVSLHYIKLILEAIKSNPDCVGISGIITTNGTKQKQWHISKDYGKWFERNGIYYRTPNHISPVKRELALKAGFPETAFGEDAEYSRRLLPLLKTEVKIKGNIYHYDYRTKK